jgi:hypothetical protein
VKALTSRLAKLEGSRAELSEGVKAWLGLRPPLSSEELAAEPVGGEVDLSCYSPELREWIRRDT